MVLPHDKYPAWSYTYLLRDYMNVTPDGNLTKSILAAGRYPYGSDHYSENQCIAYLKSIYPMLSRSLTSSIEKINHQEPDLEGCDILCILEDLQRRLEKDICPLVQ